MKKCARFLSVILIFAMVVAILPVQLLTVEAQAISDADNSEDFSKFTQTLPVLSSDKAECFVAMLCDFNANKNGDIELIHADDMYRLLTGDYSKYNHSIFALKMDLLVFSQYARTVIGSRVDGYSKNADKMAKLMIDMALELAPNPNNSELTQGILNEISGHYKALFKESLISYGAGIVGYVTQNTAKIYVTETVIDNITDWFDLWNSSVGSINKAQEIANAYVTGVFTAFHSASVKMRDLYSYLTAYLNFREDYEVDDPVFETVMAYNRFVISANQSVFTALTDWLAGAPSSEDVIPLLEEWGEFIILCEKAVSDTSYNGSNGNGGNGGDGETDSTTTVASGSCGTNVTWTLNSHGVLTISGTGAMEDYKSHELLPWFDFCKNITSVVITDGVTSIGDSAFYKCTNLTNVTIPNSVTGIGEWAFYNCGNLPSVTIPGSVTSIGAQAFRCCYSLTNIIIPDGVTSIGVCAFSYCDNLTSVTIGNSVTSIGDSAFDECTNLTSVTIGNSVTSIGDWAFDSCTSLTSVTIPDSVTSVGNYAFSYCNNLTSVTIGNGVISVGDYAFFSCTNLTSVTIGNSVTSIGAWAFRDCSSLTSVTIPDSVISVGDYAFFSCTNLTSVTIDNGVISIGESAFSWCPGLTNITIPGSVTSIGDYAFCNCDNLTYINVIANNRNYCSVDGVLFTKDMTTLIQYPNGKKENYYTILDSVISIGDYAFYNCDNLTSVTIPDSVISIGEDAFFSCTNLASATIGNSVTSIEYGAFSSCPGLTNITIPDSVNNIGDYAFSLGTNLISITIPDGVTSIGQGTFYKCTSLTSVTIPDSVISIGYTAFYECTGLKDVYYGGRRTQWEGINISHDNDSLTNAVIHCTDGIINPTLATECGTDLTWTFSDGNLEITGTGEMYDFNENYLPPWYGIADDIKSIYVQGDTARIGKNAFKDCIHVTYVAIDSSVTKIGDSAFKDCEKLCIAYYSGTKADWAKVQIGVNNEPLTAKIQNVIEEAKEQVEISGIVASSKLSYTGNPQTGYTGTPTSAYTGDYIITYEGRNGTTYNSPEAPTNAGDYTVTIKIPDTDVTYTGSIFLNFTIAKAQQATPNLRIDYSTETLSTATTTMEYSIDGGNTWHNCSVDMHATMFGWDGSAEKTVRFRTIASENYLASEVQEITISARPAAPAGLQGMNETLVGENDGQIIGLMPGTAYEISTDSGTNWTDATLSGTSMVDLAPGIYQVRLRATESTFTSIPASVEIGTGTQRTYTLNVTAPSFKSVAYGYNQPEAKPLVITSTGNSDSTIYSVVTDADAFTVGGFGNTAPAGGSVTTWTIQPKPNLGVGTYTATITVAYNNGSVAIADLTFTVEPAAQAAPSAPELESKTANSVKLKTIASNVNGAVVEYSIDNGTTWQNSPAFTDLTVNTEYSFVARYTEAENYKASPASAILKVTTDVAPAGEKVEQTAPAIPELESKTSGTITLKAIVPNANGAAAEYSKDNGVTWQASPIFTDLTANTNYSFVARYTETENYKASPVSMVLNVTTDAAATGEIGNGGTGGGGNTGGTPVIPPSDSNNAMSPDKMPKIRVAQFIDVKPGAWYYDSVKYAVENGLFHGTSENTFSSNASMTRGMLVTVLHRMAGRPAPTGDNAFTDIPREQYYADAVAWAAQNEIVGGYGNGEFAPNDFVTREQLAAILYRYAGYPATNGDLDKFTDGNEISSYAISALKWAVENSIVTGKGNSILDPGGNATRAEVAAILQRYMEKINK